MTEQEVTQEHLTYLDALRESGATNMYGAGAYLQREFGVSQRDARFILQTWMATFEQRHPGGAS
ncbi:MAG: hypothetical protein EBT98_08755 [Opitutaceae bacterium]|nr:hypothetical protein [Opitutaceae bacterium]NBR59153.1 hypothetical protein [Opitutaceae bacterium]